MPDVKADANRAALLRDSYLTDFAGEVVDLRATANVFTSTGPRSPREFSPNAAARVRFKEACLANPAKLYSRGDR